VTALGGRVSVLARQRADHVRLERLLHQLDRAESAQQDPILRRIYRLVFPHAFAEESALWPVLRRTLPDGPRLTLQIEQEHQEVNELATGLETLDLDDPRRGATLARLVGVLRQDVRDEEDVLLPRLQEQASSSQLRWLGIVWELVRRLAPTRPHPVVARRPPGNVIAALPLSLIDRTRDTVDAALQRGPRAVRPALRWTSARLAGVSHRVERLGPLRSGEHPSTARG